MGARPETHTPQASGLGPSTAANASSENLVKGRGVGGVDLTRRRIILRAGILGIGEKQPFACPFRHQIDKPDIRHSADPLEVGPYVVKSGGVDIFASPFSLAT